MELLSEAATLSNVPHLDDALLVAEPILAKVSTIRRAAGRTLEVGRASGSAKANCIAVHCNSVALRLAALDAPFLAVCKTT